MADPRKSLQTGGTSDALATVFDDDGHETTLTPTMHRALVDKLKAGAWPQDACYAVGIKPKTLKRWLLLGSGDNARQPYRSFALEFLAAESEHAREVMQTVEDIRRGLFEDARAGMVQFHAAKYILDTRYRWFWGGNGMSAAEFIDRNLVEEQEQRKQKALELLKNLPEPEKKRLREGGYLIP